MVLRGMLPFSVRQEGGDTTPFDVHDATSTPTWTSPGQCRRVFWQWRWQSLACPTQLGTT